MRIRVVPTASKKNAIQVVSKHNGKLTVHKHIGSYATDGEKAQLVKKAEQFITDTSGQSSLIDLLNSVRPTDLQITRSRPLFVYQLLGNIYDKLGFNTYPDSVVKDLIIARVYAPASKRETCEILTDFFGKDYSLKTVYRHLKNSIDKGVKDTFQKALVNFAREDLKDSLRLVFYDVTTLYFESVVKEGLRDFGFSKEHRSQETQIVVGLVVSKDGFPLYFDVFKGNTFEGHTFLPVIRNIKKLLGNTDLVVIADAAMISQDNIDKLVVEHISFVVGARVANLPIELIGSIASSLNKKDGELMNTTYHNQKLICQYSTKRAAKDRSDRLKQITKAKLTITSPSRITNRLKFIKTEGQKITLNDELIAKAEKLEGIKAYLTNTNLPEQLVIDRYHDLWRVEKAFRITKSDLEARPIFHRLDETIKAHLVIVFAGLAISKYLEMQSGMSIQQILKVAEKLLTHKVTNIKTGETAYLETTIEDEVLKEKIDLLKALGH